MPSQTSCQTARKPDSERRPAADGGTSNAHPDPRRRRIDVAGTARDLLSNLSAGVERIVATDADPERLAVLKQSLPDPRHQTGVFDVNDRRRLQSLLADCDLCINGVPTFAGFQMVIFAACLEAKRPYVDYGGMGVYTVRQKAQHDQWKDAGATAVIGLGSDPRLSNIICRAVADRLDRIDRINLYWAATKIGLESPVLVPPHRISTVLADYANPSQQFLDGRLQEVPAQAGAETIDLPEPWGRTTFIHSQHSEPLTVPFSAGIAEKGIREFTWKLSLPAYDQPGVGWTGESRIRSRRRACHGERRFSPPPGGVFIEDTLSVSGHSRVLRLCWHK